MLGLPAWYQAYEYDYRGTNSQFRPTFIKDGPFLGSMYAEQTVTHAIEQVWTFEHLTGKHQVYGTAASTYNDMMSSTNSYGRISMWVRGDSWVVTPTSYTVDSGKEHVHYVLKIYDRTDTFAYDDRAAVNCGIRTSNRQMFITLSSTGYVNQTFTVEPVGAVIPEDGQWHYVSWAWHWAGGGWKMWLDGTQYTGASVAIDDDPLTLGLPTGTTSTVEEHYYRERQNGLQSELFSRLPTAEVMVEAGSSPYIDNFDLALRRGVGFGPDVIARAVDIELEVLAYPTAVEAWQIITDLAQGSLSAVRINEQDQLMFMTLDYFGEDEQMDIEEIVDTEVNAEDLDIQYDPTKIRNHVTVEFDETRVDSLGSHVLQYRTVHVVPPGISSITLAVDVPVAEYYGSMLFDNVGPTEFALGNWESWEFFVSFNSNEFGTDAYQSETDVSATLTAHDSHTVTIEFNNRTGSSKYLVNDQDNIPYLAVKGYAIRESTGYETRRDDASITTRRDRSLSAEIPMVQRRLDATQVASKLVNLLCRPRPEVDVTVMGDPRRVPGKLVTIKDAQGTAAAGTWRILKITHNRNGADYRQDLHLVAQGDPALWELNPGWDLGVWGE
jgi:hypothetical protein